MKENKTINKMNESLNIRLAVFNDRVRIGHRPKEYSKLMNRYAFDDHREFLWMDNKCIGFIVSPFKMHPERYKALDMPNHRLVIMRQYYHIDAETIAIIKNEYVKECMFWKIFRLEDDKVKGNSNKNK